MFMTRSSRTVSRFAPLLTALATGALLGACAPAVGTVQTTASPSAETTMPDAAPRTAIVIHGGAGAIQRGQVSAEREQEYRDRLEEALRAGHAVLERGGSSVDAVIEAIVIMEDSPLFNAGRGAVFTAEGRNELDASLMEGRNREAGAVAGVTRVRNPIRLVRAVMDHSEHVMFAREGAEVFAEQQGLEMVDPEYFHTDHRYEALRRAQEAERTFLDHDLEGHALGTVGAVALDRDGNIAAGTSTGGMTNKRFGRVGDSPIIGAGTWADNRTCGVSATGHGEFFIRNAVAYDICAQMEYRGVSLREAADDVVMRKLVEHGGDGGVVALDAQGNIAMPHNTPGMYRGYVDVDGNVVVRIFGDEG